MEHKQLEEMDNDVTGNLLITGGFGNVSGVFLQLLAKDEDELKHFDTIYIMDLCEPEYAQKIIDRLPELNIVHLQQSYSRDLDYFLLENDIASVVHLVAESSQSIWRAITKVQQKTNRIITYVDASMYVSSYSSKLENHKYRLYSNFKLFDNELKGKYHNDIVGLTSAGANPFILSNVLAHILVNGDNGKLGYKNLPKEGFGKQDLKAIYVIEKDRVRTEQEFDDNTIGCSWAAYAAVEECAKEPANYFNGEDCYMTNVARGSDTNYKFNFGDGDIITDAQAIIHEECYGMAKKYGVESTFLYSVPTTLRDKLNKVASGELDFHSCDLVTFSEINGDKVSGTDKLGIMLVYKDKEVTMWNESGNVGFSSGVSYQVGVGTYLPFKILNEMTRDGYIKKLEWGEEFLEDKVFRSKLIKYMGSYLKFEIHTRNETDGVLADRAATEYDYKLINPKPQNFKDEDFNNTVNYKDVYIEYIEELLYNEFDAINSLAVNSYVFSGRLQNLPKVQNEDQFYDEVYKDFEDYMNTYSDHVDSLQEEDTMYSISLSEIETMLIDEDIAEKDEIITFMVNHVKELIGVYASEEKFMLEAHEHFIKVFR